MVLRYILFFSSLLGVLAVGSYSIYKAYSASGVLGKTGNNILIVFLITIPIVFILTTLISMKVYNAINGGFYTISSTFLPFLLYLFIGAIIITILTIFIPITKTGFHTVIVYGFMLFSLGITIYGLINAHKFTVRNITIPKSNRLSQIWSGKKIVLVSDTHIGIVHGKKFMQKSVDFIDFQKPDMVLIAGDLVDGPKFPTQDYLSPLAGLVAPMGVYYAPGNHEVYAGNSKELFAVTDQYITGLRDSKIMVNGTDIVGISYDAGEMPDGLKIRLDRSNFDAKNPSIVIIHEPKNNKTIQDAGADLVVSGHTHGGQVWPFTKFVKRIYKDYTSGLNLRNNNASITTTGIGTWGPPVRIGTRPEIIVITFE